MKIASKELIQDLIERTRRNINQAEKFQELPIEVLNARGSSESWTVLECLEHLNLYGDFYLPEIESRIQVSKSNGASMFNPGLLGNYFAKSMLPKQKLNKMKTFKDKDPINSMLDKKCIDRFIQQQHKTLELLNMASNKDLNKIKTVVSISKLIKLKLGDTFRVLIYHNQRHIEQANRLI